MFSPRTFAISLKLAAGSDLKSMRPAALAVHGKLVSIAVDWSFEANTESGVK